MIYIGYDDTGRPLGILSGTEAAALAEWPHVVPSPGEGDPDLAGLWVMAGKLVPRDQVTDQAALEAMAAQAAETLTAQITREALAAAPEPVYAAKATQATLTLALPILAKVAAGETLTDDGKARIAALAGLFTSASSAMEETEAQSYIAAMLAKSDKADAIVKGTGK